MNANLLAVPTIIKRHMFPASVLSRRSRMSISSTPHEFSNCGRNIVTLWLRECSCSHNPHDERTSSRISRLRAGERYWRCVSSVVHDKARRTYDECSSAPIPATIDRGIASRGFRPGGACQNRSPSPSIHFSTSSPRNTLPQIFLRMAPTVCFSASDAVSYRKTTTRCIING